MTPVECAKITESLLLAFPGKPFAVDVYERMLADLDYATTNAAIERLLATCKFPPMIAEIREAVLDLSGGAARPGGDAWGEVCREAARINRLSAYEVCESPELGHPRIADLVAVRAAREIGWSTIANRRTSDEASTRARFIDLYERYTKALRTHQLSEGIPAVKELRAAQQQRRLSSGDDK